MMKKTVLRRMLALWALLGLVAMAACPVSASAQLPNASDQEYEMANKQTAQALAAQGRLPHSINSSIPNDATLIASNLTVDENGVIQDVNTGRVVVDTSLVGGHGVQPDPLAKTQGRRFIPVPVKEVREQLSANSDDIGSKANQAKPAKYVKDTRDDATIRNADNFNGRQIRQRKSMLGRQSFGASLQDGVYGAKWGSMNGTPAFFQGDGELFAQQAMGVIDVSEWQGKIDWSAAKNAGVEGAIIRIGFGWDNRLDYQAINNIQACKRLGIPFGLYLYSYAYNAATGAAEGRSLVAMLNKACVKPTDLALPIYYDLEQWAIGGSAVSPTSPHIYEELIDNWFAQLMVAGYDNLAVYSYSSYLYSALNSPHIHDLTTWVASYGPRPGFDYMHNQRNWQYSDSGRIPGIASAVDLDAYGNLRYVEELSLSWFERDEDIAVGAALSRHYSQVEYLWQSYNLDTHQWETIADWTNANWAGWKTTIGNYWLHVEVRNAQDHQPIAAKTICFAYQPGKTRVTGTFAGWSNGAVLLGIASNNLKAQYHIKIYDYRAKLWVDDFRGQWATWRPRKGIYWTHYEVYTSDGRLADTKTYAFGV